MFECLQPCHAMYAIPAVTSTEKIHSTIESVMAVISVSFEFGLFSAAK